MGSWAGVTRGQTSTLQRAAIVLAVGVFLVCLAAIFPASAQAVAVFSAVTPSPNTTVTGAPAYVKLFADDTSMILGTTTMTINGAAVPVTLDYPGHWADPDCEENWVIDDYTNATISTPGTILTAEGTYNVQVTVRTQSLGTSTYSWSFAIAYPAGTAATFWSQTPAAGTTVTAPVAISTWIGPAASLSWTNVWIKLNGTNVAFSPQYGGGNSLRVVTGDIIPIDGTNTVRIGVMDSAGRYTETSWTFVAKIVPTLSAPTPTGGASYSGLRPPIGLTIADNTLGQVHLRFVVDGAEIQAGMIDQGVFRWTPTYDLASGINHVVSATVTDPAGNVSSLGWEFNNGVLFASTLPSRNTTVGGSPGQVSVYVDTPSVILDGARIWVDGVLKPTTVQWVGHIEDPDCEAIWVVDDWTAATISAPSGVLLEGSHTVYVEVDTQSGGTVSYTWSFTIAYPPGSQAAFSNRAPLPGAIVTADPQLKVSVVSPTAVYKSQISIYLDGVLVPSSSNINFSTHHHLTVAPTSFTSRDGTRTVRVSVLSGSGVLSEDTWSFQSKIVPTFAGQYPTVAVPARVPRPQIGVQVTDNAPGQLRVRFKLDGVTSFDGQVDQGIFRYTPTSDFANNSSHSVVVDAWDAAGNTASLSWTFNVVAQPAMSDSGSCVACHTTFPGTHSFANCSGCHADDPLYDPHDSNRFAPLGPCYDCHGSSYNHPPAVVSNCTWCHTNPDWTQIPRHDASPAHVTTRTECGPCHDANLVTEHAKYPSASAFKYQCATCHVTQVAAYNTAIANHDTDCYSCHGAGDPHHVQPDLSALAPPSGPQCSTCHTGLTLEHLKPTSTSAADGCDACHAAGGARDSITGAWDRTCDTTGCHDAAGARPVHENYCFACHDTSQPDFSVAKTAFPPVIDVNRDTACKACHTSSLVGTHPYHQSGSNCGAACHPGWGTSLVSATPLYVDPVSGASFGSVGSKSTPAALLHSIHANPRWPATLGIATSVCSSCHATAACNACHTGAVPSTHAEHSATDQADNPAWTGVVSYGVVGGDQTQRSAFTDTIQCASPECHDLAASAASAPHALEDYNYTIGTNPDDPDAANAAITTLGTWRWRASNRYTGGRMSYANIAGATLAAAFTGERVEIVSDMDPYRGRAEVLVDGVVVGSFDSYAPTTRFQVPVFSTDVTPGAHIMIPINPAVKESKVTDTAADEIAQAVLPLPEDLRAG
ncbi:MAG: hypothetical protein KJ747_06365, partial [Actinobacteria bacterium]|nr:hypothetical protein [Actinomycetota bacterium]